MSDIKFNRLSEVLNNKLDRDFKNSAKPYIIETYSNETSWYRVYSDSWCEQGGEIVSTGTSQYKNVTFLKPFANTNYFAVGTLVNENTYAGIRDKTTESISFFSTSSGGNKNANVLWEACGYIA